ncbi:hypothetical protein D3C71_739480 [compost metagenome]
MRCGAIPEIEGLARHLNQKVSLIELRVQPGFGAPLRGRLRAGWWWHVPAEGLEHLADETFRCPVGQANPAARPTDPRQLRCSLGLVRGEHYAESRKHGVETGIVKRQRFGIGHLKRHVEALSPRSVFAAFEQCGHIVGRRNQATPARSGQCGIAVAGGDVEHLLIAQQVAGFGQLLADNLQGRADHGIVATGPSGHLTVFQGSKINGCTHGDDLWVETRISYRRTLTPPWWDR